MPVSRRIFLLICCCFFMMTSRAQLIIQPAPTAQALAQRLVGEGVSISNVTLSADPRSIGFFRNAGGTQLGIDSGIVLTNGRAKTDNSQPDPTGLDGNGSQQASSVRADLDLNRNGDGDLDAILNGLETNDASVLEFDFVPLGDSIKFRYVFSSEEYPDFACTSFNDAFAFFIQGPGFPFKTNIARIPGTGEPVTINNINGSSCSPPTPFPQYFINNETNRRLTHNGHTVVLTALARVQPCQTYHLKLVIADVEDWAYDSGVFLEAKSLSSNATQLINLTQTDPVNGNSYLVEGCATGSLNIKRAPGAANNFPLVINLTYGGTAVNGTDFQPLPPSIIIPTGEDSVLLNIFPVMDLVPEGIETLKIYTLAGCAAGLPTDSTEIQLRDYDILGIAPDTSYICRNGTLQLQASSGYTTYTWNNNPALSNPAVANPTVTLGSGSGMFICTAAVGTCQAKDSAFVKVKDMELLGKTDVNCKNGTTGQISVGAGFEWPHPLEFSINGGATYQTDSSFSNLPVGNYTVMIRDASGCIDSIQVPVVQAYPDLVQNNVVTQASCTGNPDGTITVNTSGGNPNYLYSLNNGSFGNNNSFNVTQGNYTVVIRDANGCTVSTGNIAVTLNNTLLVEAGPDETICEGTSVQLNAVANNSSSYSWTPSVAVSNSAVSNPTVSPVTDTKYMVTVSSGICTYTDSVMVLVNPAPVPDAGADITICFGASATLQGSGAVEYSWTPSTYLNSSSLGQPTAQRPLDNISYYLHIKDANGCASLVQDTVNITVTPAVKLFAGNDSLFVAINQPVQLNAVQIGDQTVTQYSWAPSYGLNTTSIQNPVATLDRDITYYVTGRTPANCEGSDTINIKVYRGPEIYVPTAFTPNGDGRNDILKAIAIGMKEYRYFRVFNRYGQIVFESRGNFSRGWDGRVKGKLQNTGTFVWMAETVDYRGNLIQRKGTTMIVQ